MSKLSDNTLSIICILIGMTVFSLQDVLIRVLSDEISAFQILFTRSIIGISLLCIYLKYKKIPIIFTSHYPALTILIFRKEVVAVNVYFEGKTLL